MAIERKWYYFFPVLVFAWGGFGMGISSISSTSWIHYDVGDYQFDEGLFQGQVKVNETKFSVERLGFIDATAGCYITALIFGFVVALQSTQSSRLFSRKFYTIGLGCVIFATILDVIGVSLYQAQFQQGYSGSGAPYNSNDTIKIGYGLIAAWVVFCCHFITSCVLTFLYIQLDDWV